MYGTATVTDSAYRGFPFEDSQQAFISNASGSISPGTLESNLGLVTGSFDSMGNGTTSEGSAMVQNFNVLEGSTLTFRWNFATEETEAFFLANDFAFVHIQRIGASSQPPETLSSQLSMGNTATQTGSPLRTDGYTRETGYQTFTYLIPASGNYQLAFGVLDVRDGDVAFDSALFVDDVQMLAPVPEPWACSLAAGIGLGLFAVARRLTVRSRTAHVA